MENLNFLKTDESYIFYTDTGEGEVVIFLHGFSLDHRMWNAQVEYFKEKYRVVTYDMRGFGKSSKPSGARYSHVTDLKALVELLNVKKFHLIGFSRGGKVAIDYARSYGEELHSLIIVAAIPSGYVRKLESMSELHTLSTIYQEEGLDKATELWLSTPLFEHAKSDPVIFSKIADLVSEYDGWHWGNKNPEQLLNPNVASELEQISVPTLVIIGQKDSIDHVEAGEYLVKNLPNSQLLQLQNTGHMINIENPDRFNKAVNEFIEESIKNEGKH